MESFKERLVLAMQKRKMKAIDLSEKTGISEGSISQYRSGRSEPNNKKTYLIAKALNVREAWLLGYDVPMDRENHRIEFSDGSNRFAEEVGKRVKNQMSKQNLTLTDIARSTHLTEQEVQYIIDGKDSRFSEDLMWKLAEIIGEEPIVFFCKYYPIDSVGENMKVIREIANVSTETVAKAIGISIDEIAAIEEGSVKPLFSTIDKFSAFFGIEPQQTICKDYRVFANDDGVRRRLKAHALLSQLRPDQQEHLLQYSQFLISQK